MNKKKVLAAVLAIALLGGAIGGVVAVVRKVNAKVISVIPVESLIQNYYYDVNENQEMSGTVTTSATQKVQLDNEAIIEDVYVKVGDKVKVGERLMSYDVTLTEMELELEKLTMERNQRRLKKAEKRLTSLENGGPIEDEEYEEYDWEDNSSDSQEDSAKADESVYPGDNPLAMAVGAFRPLRAVNTSIEEEQTETDIPKETPEVTPTEEPNETETPSVTPSASPEETPIETPSPQELEAYIILDEESIPYEGTGTVDDPYRFLCSSQEEYIIVKGSFLNKMAGYNPEGTEKLNEDAPFWYRLEFHEGDTIANPEDIEASLIGYYTRKGGKEPMNPAEEKHFSVDGAMLSADDTAVLTPTPTPDQEEDPDTGDEDWGDEPDAGEGPSREDAIKSAKSSINNLKLQIKTNKLQISKLQKKIENQTILASIDGTVTVVGDPVTGKSDSEGFIEVESDDGLFVEGAIGELALEQFIVGQVLTGTAYESGVEIEMELREISQFPVEDAQQYFNGMSNPNMSYYTFLAEVTNTDIELVEGEGISVRPPTQTATGNALSLEAAFVRNENGIYYVYKEEDGKLKKQIVTATKSFDGYSVSITSGLKKTDKIAFPYGRGVEEGAPTKEGSMDELYGYY